MKPFYITTPIYYPNGQPHLGTAYCTITADVLSRFHRLFGEPSFFLTGTDEHGQKIQQAAEKRGIPPLEFCNEIVAQFEQAWQNLDIDYDIFYRTTNPVHIQAVQKSLQDLYERGEIYSDTYQGWYQVSEETFYTEKDLVDGKSPTGLEVTRIEEKNYFFKMSNYQQQLIEHIHSHPDYIVPEFRRNEVLGFLKQPLADLCISRPKSRLNWGIEIPFDPDYVVYVWFDALLNYASAVGLNQPDRQNDFEKWWIKGGAVHLIGKDILTFHAVYWSTMLMALKLPLPRQIVATGWILNRDSEKMSKSKGETISPVEISRLVGVDEFRYFLTREVHLGNDAPFSLDLLESRVNSELANNLGNLLSRTTNLVEKFFAGKKPPFTKDDEFALALKNKALALPKLVREEIENMRPSYALEHVIQVLTLANRYLEEKAPWKLAKIDLPEAGHVLSTTLEVLRITGFLLKPVMPVRMDQLLSRIGAKDTTWANVNQWPGLPDHTPIAKSEPLFPRLDLK